MGIENIKTVYLLYHISYDKNNRQTIDEDGYLDEDLSLLGVFSSELEALEIQDKYKILPDFKDYPDSFLINEYTINEMHYVD